MRFRSLLAIFLAGLFVLLGAPAAHAQFETGSVIGTVKDASGAVVSGATVTVTNVATNIKYTRTTNDSGDYEVPGLRVGTYDVEITKEGFSPSVAKGVSLSIAARQRVDQTLTIGNATTSVDVTATSPLIETDTSQRGLIVTNYQTSSLPLVSRNYSDLLALSPGVHQAPNYLSTTATTGLIREGGYNVNGQRSIFNNFLLDGMDNNAYGESNQGFSNQIFNPPPDSIAQFQVVTNNQSAEYGRASGATFNVAYRSGTNKYHGLAYEFIRNRALNAIGYFKPATNAVKPQFNRNQFGGNFGGPILRDKLFFFLDYEGFRQLRSQNSSATLPTNNQRARIFAKPVYNPFDGTMYAAGTPIPTTAPGISPIALRVISLLPANTGSGTTNNYFVLQRSSNNSDKGSIRLDYQLDPKDSFFLRVSDLKQNATDFPAFPLPIDGNTNGKQRILDQQIAVGWNRIIGSNQFLDARLGLSRTKAGKFSLSIGDNSFGAIPGLPSDPSVAGGLPSTSISGFTALGRQATNPQFQNPAVLNPKINYSWVLGRHSLKFGYEYQHIWMAVQDTNPLYGGWAFAGGFSRNYDPVTHLLVNPAEASTTDNAMADYLFGAPSQYQISSYFVAHLRNQSNYAYVQDDWKITPKLTLNIGLRYEYGSPYWEQKNLQTNFNPDLAASGPAAMYSATDGNRTLVDSDKNDWAPRFGFVYAPDTKTSLRGGYGVSYVHYSRAGSGDILAINAPQALFITQNQVPARATTSSTPGPFRTTDSGFPAALTFDPATDNITYVDSKRFRDSYVHSYYLSVQREVMRNAMLEVAYVGNHGLKLAQFANANQKRLVGGALVRPLPVYGDVTIALHTAYSHYDGLQVKYEQRMVSGLTLLNSFTYSHTLDSAGASLEANTPSPQDYYNLNADYSTSEYDQPIVNTTSLVYELPFGRGKRFLNSGGVINQVIGGWQLSAVNQAMSGVPFNITYAPLSQNQVSGIGSSFRGSNLYRPNRVQGQSLINYSKTPGANGNTATSMPYLNLAALSIPASGSLSAPLSPFGNLQRDAGRTTPINFLNLAINKSFALPFEGGKIEFRSELYNIFNHTNFAPPGGLSVSISPSAATQPTGGGAVTTTYDPRIVQFGLKVAF
jgi:hypothetical protein